MDADTGTPLRNLEGVNLSEVAARLRVVNELTAGYQFAHPDRAMQGEPLVGRVARSNDRSTSDLGHAWRPWTST